MGNYVDDFVVSMNRAAEDAVVGGKPIFVDAIKAMTVQDAWNILKGQDNAATTYLRTNTETKLTDQFKPVIQNSLDKVGVTKVYTKMMTAYNKIPLVQKVETDLAAYTTKKTMDGLFLMIADEEKNIRDNPFARTTDLLKKVFDEKNRN